MKNNCLASLSTPHLKLNGLKLNQSSSRKRKVSNDEHENLINEQLWEKLAVSIQAIYASQPLKYSLEELFRTAKVLTKPQTTDTLYKRLESIFETHIKTLVFDPSTDDKSKMHIIFNNIW